jgi:dTDP-4-amino-4,6-dideoxygalactose transaminase
LNPSAVLEFEQAFAQWAGLKYAFAFWKGRVALYATLRALEVGQDDEVLLPGYTCVMVVNPIKYVGAKPVYVDIDPVTYNMDPALLARTAAPRAKALLAQHTYGFPCDLDALAANARERGIPLIEDCCLALGSRYRGRLCGQYGRAAYWSFQWNKHLTTGLGGVVATNDAELAARIREVRDREMQAPPAGLARLLAAERLTYAVGVYPRTTALIQTVFRWLSRRGAIIGSNAPDELAARMAPDFFLGMSAGQARTGLRKLRRVDANLAHRRGMRRLYDELLAQAGWTVPALPAHLDPVLVRYPVRVADKERALHEGAKHLVEVGAWFESPLHPAETPLERYDYRLGQCPEAERAAREVVNLPTHPRAGPATARRSVRFLRTIGPPRA